MILRMAWSLIFIDGKCGRKSFPERKQRNTKSSRTLSKYCGSALNSLKRYSLNSDMDKN